MTLQRSYPSPEGNESSRLSIYPLKMKKIREKSLFMLENIFSGAKLYPFFEQTKNSYVRRNKTSLQQPPW